MDLWHGKVFVDGEILDQDDRAGQDAAKQWAENVLRAAGHSIEGAEWRCVEKECQLEIRPGLEARLYRKV